MICQGATYWGFSTTGIFLWGVALGAFVMWIIGMARAAAKEEPKPPSHFDDPLIVDEMENTRRKVVER